MPITEKITLSKPLTKMFAGALPLAAALMIVALLADALTGAAMAISLPGRNPERQAEHAPPAPKPPRPPDYNVTLSASLGPETARLTQGLAWVVRRAGAKPKRAKAIVWRGAGGEPKLKLAPGRYRVSVTYGMAKAERVITVTRGEPLDAALSLGGGELTLSAVARRGGPALDHMFYSLYRLDRDEDASTQEQDAGENASGGPGQNRSQPQASFIRSSQAEPVFYLPAGRYRIVAQHGYAEVQDSITLRPGQALHKRLVIRSGRLRPFASLTPGGKPLANVFFHVYRLVLDHRAEDSGAQGDEEIARSALAEPVFDLPAGVYRVVVDYGQAHAEAGVSVRPGGDVALPIVLNAGGLSLSARYETNAGVVYTVYRLADEASDEAGARAGAANKRRGKEVARTAQANPTLYLGAGRYRIEAHYGAAKARQSRIVTITAGEMQKLDFTQVMGRARLSLTRKAGGAALGGVKWSVRDDYGQEVFTSASAMPEIALAPGRYKVRAERGGRKFDRSFVIVPQKTTIVELVQK